MSEKMDQRTVEYMEDCKKILPLYRQLQEIGWCWISDENGGLFLNQDTNTVAANYLNDKDNMVCMIYVPYKANDKLINSVNEMLAHSDAKIYTDLAELHDYVEAVVLTYITEKTDKKGEL